MTPKLRRLRRLCGIKQFEEQQAAGRVSQARQTRDRETERLDRLQQEHRRRCVAILSSRSGTRLDLAEQMRLRGFLEDLVQQITRQAQAVSYATQRLQELARTWQERRSERKALQRFEERILLHRQQDLQRREQRTLDELGVRNFLRNAKDEA